MQKTTVSILGTEYQVFEDYSLRETGYDGECDGYIKEIRIREMKDLLSNLPKEDNKNEKLRKMRQSEVLRHELMHAFFCESGLDNYSADEQLVSWFASQFPKINKVFQQLDVLG